MRDADKKVNPMILHRNSREVSDYKELRAFLEKHYMHAQPNSDSSIELWALSALINCRGTIQGLWEDIVGASSNGLATAQVGWIQSLLDLEKSKPHDEQRPVMISSLEILLAEMKQRQGVVTYTVGDDAGEDD